MQAIQNSLGRFAFALYGVLAAFSLTLIMAAPSFAQNDPGGLGAGAKEAATSGVTYGAAVALVIIAAVIVYKLVKRFSS
jgi:hypothetical protein